MTPFKKEGHHIILELLYNRKHKRGRWVVDNAFGILKKTFREFLTKTELHVFFVPYAFTAYCLLHNFLRSQSKSHILRLMRIIDVDLHVNTKLNATWRVIEVVEDQTPTHTFEGQERFNEAMRRELNIYLGFVT
jgi:hypothetical protein